MMFATMRVLGLALALAAGTAQAADTQPVVAPAGKDAQGYATGDMVLGRPDAPVTVIEYASMTCPHCAAFQKEELPALKAAFIDTGKARLVFREFPLDGFALRGAMLARCAGPERFFAVIDVLFQQQATWTRPPDIKQDPLSELRKLAKQVGIGEQAFERCMADKTLEDKVIESRLDGDQRHKIEATPAFVVQGRTLTGGSLLEAVAAAVKQAESRN